MNSTNFFKRWKEGILNLSPVQQIKAKLIGTVGGIVGLIMALVTMIYKQMWGFSVFIFFIIWLQFTGYISLRQQYVTIKEMMKNLEADMQSKKIDKELGNI